MNIPVDTLNNGFGLRDCMVFPSRNVIENRTGEHNVEPKAMQVLMVLASSAGRVVSREQLLDAVWPDTFSGDAALTRCISLLRSSLGETRDKHQFIETVSKSGYRLVAPVKGLDMPVPVSPAGDQKFKSFGTVAVIWAGVAVIIGILAFYFWTASDRKPAHSPVTAGAVDVHTIAILPFANMSGDSANEYLSDGVSEEILNVLAQVPDLRVTSRSSSFVFRETGLALSEIADRLGVDSLLEGSVRISGDRIRISVQLVEAHSELLLWSKNYDRLLDDVFQIQDEIAQAVASTLIATLDLSDPKVPGKPVRVTSDSVNAHIAFLRGRYLAAKRTKRSLEDAIPEFGNALSIDPDHAAAMSELSVTYLLLSSYGDLGESEAMSLAQPLASRAIELEPGLAEAQAAFGFVAWRQGQSERAELHFRHALEINPSYAIVHHWLSMLSYRDLGKHREAFEASRRARALDPVSVPISSIYIQLLIARGLFTEAALELEKLRTISEASYRWLRGELDGLNGQWANVLLANLDALMVDAQLSRGKFVLASGLIRLGLAEEATLFDVESDSGLLLRLGKTGDAVRIAREQLNATPQSANAMKNLARALVYTGEKNEAKALLEELWKRANRRAAIVSTHFFSLGEAIALHNMRKEGGDDEGASEIIAGINAEIQRARAAGISVTRRGASLDFAEGLCQYLSGDEEPGLANIRRAVEEGYYINLAAPFYRELSKDPRFKPILRIQDATRERELQVLLQSVCRENPYADVWQPSTQTCTGQKAETRPRYGTG